MSTIRKFSKLLHILLVVLLIYIKVSLGIEENKVRCIEKERRALLSFKQELIDDYGRLSSWGSEEEKMECCKWEGVQCSNRTSHVILLDLHDTLDQPLRGNLSSSLLELQYLTYLDLGDNDLGYNQIPEFIGSLSRLKYLNLKADGLAGTIPPQLGNLTNLQYLNLGHNTFLGVKNLEWLSNLHLLRHLDLSGVNLTLATDWVQVIKKLPFLTDLVLSYCVLPQKFPNSLFSINSSASLSILDLSDNGLASDLTYHWLFNLSTSLTSIDLSYNSLEGPIPDGFGDMISLVNLDLFGNRLGGSLPKSIGNLSRLQSLNLSMNSFSEELPEFLQMLYGSAENSLEVLGLSSNQFSGSLPDLTTFPSLRELDLAKNNLSGRLPESIGKLSELQILDVSSNSLHGTISEAHLSNLSNLKQLRLSFNSLALDISSDWAPPFQLDVIRLAYCFMGPHFPKWLQTQNNFSELDISGVGISETMPNWFWDLSPRLQYLNLSYNKINGLLPDLSKRLVGFPRIDLSSNQFEGAIPLFSSNVTSLYLSNNRFTGTISFFCALENKHFNSIDLSNNLLSGELPDCWMHTKELTILNLANNNFSGKIPNSMGSLDQVQMLQFRNNNFMGELPSSLKNCGRLKILDLGENKFTGKIPSWIGTHLTNLIVLSLRMNEFYGSISRQICHLDNIQILDLSHNNISGNIPQCFGKFTSLVQTSSLSATIESSILAYEWPFHYTIEEYYIGSALVQWKGQESYYRKNLGLLKSIDISSNNIVGEIPQKFSSLLGLVSLNLSRNNLTGNIIYKIGEMEMLESLDLSRNHLSGVIPSSIANLYYLSVLDLSNNNLSGKIPLSTQLQSFDASAYAGNNELCGLPLPKCPGEETKGHSKDAGQEDENRSMTPEFYKGLGLGFVFGFWGLFGCLLFKDSWRYAYFNFLNNIQDWLFVTMAVNMARLHRMLKT